MRISNKTNIIKTKIENRQIKSTRNPISLYKMMKIYSQERKEIFPYFQAILNSIDTMLNNCKMRLIKDEFGNIIAAYTYRLRKNRLGQKSMYIDALVRNFKKHESKNSMNHIYKDMKDIAQKKKAEEMTLFSGINDTALRSKYESLGFNKDEKTFIYGGYFMRVKTKDFLKKKQ